MGKKAKERLPEKQSTLVRNFQPRNQKQAEFVKLIKRNEQVNYVFKRTQRIEHRRR